MKKIKTRFKDLLVFETKIYPDKRGNVREAFKKNLIKKGLFLSVVSKSKKNVIRGLHFQSKKTQDKFISVIKGRILDVVVDLRKNSKTFGQHFKIVLSEKKAKYLFVPKGFAHGFLTLDKENIVLYSCSNYRSPKHEKIIKWNDKDLKIKWGIKKPILSNRDQNAQNFADYFKKR
tara:strand:- start:6649 stop:7173 length:525 start_codon:yes stop_codon:yes gene_type:complete